MDFCIISWNKNLKFWGFGGFRHFLKFQGFFGTCLSVGLVDDFGIFDGLVVRMMSIAKVPELLR